MKNHITKFAILLVTLVLTQTAFADVKIKTRQTMSGQSSENMTYIKGKRMRSEQNMGGMQTVNITQCDLKRSLRIMPQGQTYMVDLWQTAPSVAPTTTSGKTQIATKGGVITMIYTTKDTGERKQMFGYTAKHLITTMESDSSPDACSPNKSKMEIDGWYIDAAFALDCANDQYKNYRPDVKSGGCQDRYDIKQVGVAKKGYPVWEKMTMFDASNKESYSVLSEVLELSSATLDAALFDVPQGYREVKDSTELYASMSNQSSTNNSSISYNSKSNSATTNSQMNSNVENLSKSSSDIKTEVGAKKEGVIRVGLATVKTGAIGEGLNAAQLSQAVQNTLSEYLKSPRIELVALDAKLQSAIDEEAKSKQCDYVIYTNVSHKKGGGGGFGMFKKVAPALSNVVPLAGMGGSVAGAVAGTVASQAIYTAAGMSENVKSKDEITLDVRVTAASAASAGGSTALAKQFKAKAKGDGDDIITQVIEQAAQAILDSVS